MVDRHPQSGTWGGGRASRFFAGVPDVSRRRIAEVYFHNVFFRTKISPSSLLAGLNVRLFQAGRLRRDRRSLGIRLTRGRRPIRREPVAVIDAGHLDSRRSIAGADDRLHDVAAVPAEHPAKDDVNFPKSCSGSPSTPKEK
jgi:hypothetical protein